MAVLIPQIGTLFLLSPGTGSTSLAAWFIEHLGGEWVFPTKKHKHATPQQLAERGLDLSRYVVVTTTRNPFDFYISQYHKKRTWVGETQEFRLAKDNPFPVFLERFLAETPDGELHPTYLNAADVVLRKECLEADVQALLHHLGVDCEVRLPQLNVSADLSHRLEDWYAPDDLLRVRDKHAAQLERFGYGSRQFAPEQALRLDAELPLRLQRQRAAPLSEFVLPGKDGWLYLGDASNAVLQCTGGTFDRTRQWLDAWREELEARRRAAAGARRGTATYVAPNTHSALPQYLPDTLSLSAERPIAALLQALPELDYPLQQMSDPECYIRNDSHHSEYGAYRLYRHMCRQHGLEPVEVPREAFAPSPELGDLGVKVFPARHAPRLTLTDAAREMLGLTHVQSLFHSQVSAAGRFEVRHNPQANSGETLVIFGDSYSNRLFPFFTLNFRHVIFLHSTCPPLELIDACGADLVLFVHAERFMHQMPERRHGAHHDDYRTKLQGLLAAGTPVEPPSYCLEALDGLDWLVAEIVALENIHDRLQPNRRLNLGKLAELGRTLLHRQPPAVELLDKCRRHPNLQSAMLEMIDSEEFAAKNGRPRASLC